MKIMIVGGTGLLGHEAAQVALERGHDVTSLAIPDVPMDGWYPEQIKTLEGDVFKLTQAELAEIFKGYDAMIYAVGPDDRITPNEPAYEFFKLRLVDHAAKVFRAARDAGIKKAALCSSYFLYFDRKFPKKNLAEIHPYIRVRKEQAELILKEAVAELKGQKAEQRVVAELDVDVEAFAPDDYIPVQSERIDFYRRLAGCGSIEEIASVAAQVQEVYGSMPRPVQNLVSVARLKLLASSAGVSKVVVRPGRGELVFAQKQYMMNKKVFDALAESGDRVSPSSSGYSLVFSSSDYLQKNRLMQAIEEFLVKLQN